jgi:hypothetical protein
MRTVNMLIHDEYIPAGHDATNPVYTGVQFNEMLGHASRIGVQVVADNPGTTATIGALRLLVEMSHDGKVWTQRGGGTADLAVPATGNFTAGQTATYRWTDACRGNALGTGPLFSFVRFARYFTNQQTFAHVKVYVTQRGHR